MAGHHGDWVGARRWIAYAAELHSPLLYRLTTLHDRAVFVDRAHGIAQYLRREAEAWRRQAMH